MLPDQTVTMTWNGPTKKYYTEKGYEYTGLHTTFEVDVHDLPKKSGKRIKVICDFCHEPYYPYNSNFNRDPNPPHCCGKDSCKAKKQNIIV